MIDYNLTPEERAMVAKAIRENPIDLDVPAAPFHPVKYHMRHGVAPGTAPTGRMVPMEERAPWGAKSRGRT